MFDPTAVCVALFIVGLTLVWAYVMVGGRSKQPDLSQLYAKETGEKGSGGRKGGKAKSKSKQVSPRLLVCADVSTKSVLGGSEYVNRLLFASCGRHRPFPGPWSTDCP